MRTKLGRIDVYEVKDKWEVIGNIWYKNRENRKGKNQE
jgi:hypothetical protein